MEFTRYAIYFAPPTDADWVRYATSWLGWDMQARVTVGHPDLPIPIAAITGAPRKYGLHATMKPPFHLAEGVNQGDLESAVTDLSGILTPLTLGPLHLTRLGRFLALCPAPSPDLSALAAACVQDLDHLRRPLAQTELERRRAAKLTARQEENLMNWGYPHVLEDFRFHITLTGRLPEPNLSTVQNVLECSLCPLLPPNLPITDLALTGEDNKGRFHLLRRFALSGTTA